MTTKPARSRWRTMRSASYPLRTAFSIPSFQVAGQGIPGLVEESWYVGRTETRCASLARPDLACSLIIR